MPHHKEPVINTQGGCSILYFLIYSNPFKMKKVITYGAIILLYAATVQAQSCPIAISDPSGDGDAYNIILSSAAQCANYANNSIVTLNGQNFTVASCNTAVFGMTSITTLTLGLAAGGTLIPLSSSAPVTFAGGSPTAVSGCTYNSSGIPIALPIELIEFKGTPSVSGNVLTWTTVREVSNRGFQVERLVSDKTWLPISFVKSKGAYGKYEFTDNNPLPTSYYRLRQLDNDGTETFSKTVTVATKGINKLKAYPNPVGTVLTVETDNKDVFQILNFLGQQILTGKAASQVDVSALPEGTYVLKVGTEVAKFVKQ
jgi:Secretion system C-terminal sorting domain